MKIPKKKTIKYCDFWVFAYIIEYCLNYCIFTKLSQIVCLISVLILVVELSKCDSRLWKVIEGLTLVLLGPILLKKMEELFNHKTDFRSFGMFRQGSQKPLSQGETP